MCKDYPYSVEIAVSGHPDALRIALLSLEPEMGRTDRTEVTIDIRDKKLFLKVSAVDSTALRAGINSYMRWLHEALRVCETISEERT